MTLPVRKPSCIVCYLVLPIVPLGSRAAVRGLSPQVRGGRCRSNAARAKCRLHNGFHCQTVWAVRKRDRDALRRFGSHTRRIVDAVRVKLALACDSLRFATIVRIPAHLWHAGKSRTRLVAPRARRNHMGDISGLGVIHPGANPLPPPLDLALLLYGYQIGRA